MTPRTVKLVLEADVRRLQREHNARAWLAHTTAGLQRVRNFPRLESLLVGEKPAKRPQSPQEQLAAWRAIAGAYDRKGRSRPDGQVPHPRERSA